jgi:hypothetical protein
MINLSLERLIKNDLGIIVYQDIMRNVMSSFSIHHGLIWFDYFFIMVCRTTSMHRV